MTSIRSTATEIPPPTRGGREIQNAEKESEPTGAAHKTIAITVLRSNIPLSVITACALALSAAACRTVPRQATVRAVAGTVPLPGGADGVAIWVNPENPAESAVIGARPSKGLGVFTLDGKLTQRIDFPKGGAGEVDVRYFPLNGKETAVVAGAVKGGQTIYAYKMAPKTRKLVPILENPPRTNVKPYGSALYLSSKTGKLFLFVTSKAGVIEQYELIPTPNGKLKARLARLIRHAQQGDPVMEACVADDEKGFFYVSQENECRIWRYDAEPDGGTVPLLVDNARMGPKDNVEGLAIYKTAPGKGYLIASLQNSWKYKVYSLEPPYELLGIFDIRTAEGALVKSHDCIEVTNKNLGGCFKNGVFATQNANNKAGHHFQIVPWNSIASPLGLDTADGD